MRKLNWVVALLVAGSMNAFVRGEGGDAAPPEPVVVSVQLDKSWKLTDSFTAKESKSQISHETGFLGGNASFAVADSNKMASALDDAAQAASKGDVSFKGVKVGTFTVAVGKAKMGEREVNVVHLTFPGLMGDAGMDLLPEEAKTLADVVRNAPKIDARLRKCVDAKGMFQ